MRPERTASSRGDADEVAAAALDHAEAKAAHARLARDQMALISTRQAAEWGMRALQGAFGRLKIPMDCNDAEGRGRLIRVCVRIHQLRCRAVGLNQLKEVFINTWKDAETHYEDFGDLLFRDIMSKDRISRYYNLPTAC